MKFEHYLNEDLETIIKILKKNVKPSFLNAVKQAHSFLYRGSKHDEIDGILQLSRRKDRVPMSMNDKVHNTLDRLFLKKFGWKARSEGVFVTGSVKQAYFYGSTHLFFPIGKYRFIWSPTVYDLFSDMRYGLFVMYKREKNLTPSVALDDLEDINDFTNYLYDKFSVFRYTNKNLKDAITSRHEIMFDCDEYYIVERKYEDYILESLT